MSKIKTSLSVSALTAINQMWKAIEFDDSFHGKVHKSIIEHTAAKFLKKQIGYLGEVPKKDIKIGLTFFEASILEIYLRQATTNYLYNESYEHNLIIKYCNQLHQITQ